MCLTLPCRIFAADLRTAYLTIAMARYAMVMAKATNAGDISLALSFAFLW
jgi:hypothetical protein